MSDAAPGVAPPARVRIWDLPTRLFHWLVALLIPAMWWTAEYDRIQLHILLGLLVVFLVLFRLLWGLLGSSTARFANFLTGPRGVISYLNGRAAHVLGHNPLGGWSVVALLGVLTAQVGLGLFASDEDGLYAGPLSLWLDGDTVEQVTEWHEWLFNVVLALIVLHLAAIAFYAVRKRNLIGPMLSGRGAAPEGTAAMQDAPLWRLLVALLISAGVTLWLWSNF